MKFHNGEERIDKGIHNVYFDGYLILQSLALVSLTLKMYLINISMTTIVTELVILLGGNLYILIRALFLRVNLIDFFKGKDEFCLTYRNKIFYEGFYLEFICLIGMMPLLAFLVNKGVFSYSSLLILFFNIEFFIPCIYVTYKSMKQGLLIPKMNKKKQKLRKILGAIVGAIIFIVIMNWSILVSGQVLTIRGMIFILKDIIIWILFFVIPINFIVKKSEKNGDKLAS